MMFAFQRDRELRTFFLCEHICEHRIVCKLSSFIRSQSIVIKYKVIRSDSSCQS